ncbi:MAG: hypothetical protein L0Z50_31705, partial [Verrucomicrobiales bacterium]|nr:hypothetical protein [Verrucomicrobiales bacterium]
LSPFEFFVRPTRTRFPFRYGIASMTDVPHLFARTTVTVGGKSSFGLSSEGLPPKWFTKNPVTTFEQDLPEMLQVISHAAKLAERIAESPVSYFDFWSQLYRQQQDWADARHIAPLLANLGVSLVERAALDGLCRVAGEPLHRILGPVALLQDLALMALLGIEHVERNGHHYYRGLRLWPGDWQDATLAAHGDLYARHRDGFACLHIRGGRVGLDSVNAAPLGVKPLFDPSRFDGQSMP